MVTGINVVIGIVVLFFVWCVLHEIYRGHIKPRLKRYQRKLEECYPGWVKTATPAVKYRRKRNKQSRKSRQRNRKS